jgi:hypothetical protein
MPTFQSANPLGTSIETAELADQCVTSAKMGVYALKTTNVSGQTTQSTYEDIEGLNHFAQVFNPSEDGKMTHIDVITNVTGSPANLMLDIQTVTANKPSGTSLLTTPQEIDAGDISGGTNTIYLDEPLDISNGTQYALVLYQKANGGDGSNKYRWHQNGAGGYTETDCDACASADGGSTWSIVTGDDNGFGIYISEWV